MGFADFFRATAGMDAEPYPYQTALAEGPWPHVIDVPTGLGKTSAVILPWLYRRLAGDDATPRRLVYCLPMRTLVEQTWAAASRWVKAAASEFEARHLEVPSVHLLMGGHVDDGWDQRPEHPSILVGTQDMLLSRALNRGYAMSRYRWPVHFGLLHTDALWVLDETQLMGVGVETSAQLEAFRTQMGTFGPSRTLWMSATLGREQLETVDHGEPRGGWRVHGLGPADHAESRVRQRLDATKVLGPLPEVSLTLEKAESYPEALARQVEQLHGRYGGLTLVILNRVSRAQALRRALAQRSVEPLGLIHSRFRPMDREAHRAVLLAGSHRVVVATQAVEAGMDVSARTLITELAPWPSLVQRFGRCNRYGEQNDEARIFWIDIEAVEKNELALPYEAAALDEARTLLRALDDACPSTLASVAYKPPRVTRPVLRRPDLLDLFDTTPDILGDDLDISRYVRDGQDSDVQVYWRDFREGESPCSSPSRELALPFRDELCAVSIGAVRAFIDALARHRRKVAKKDPVAASRLYAWAWNTVEASWSKVTRPRPGMCLLLPREAGGYDPAEGWTGQPGMPAVPPVQRGKSASSAEDESLHADPATDIGRWVPLTRHLGDVEAEARAIATALGLPQPWAGAVITAAGWHDIGKAHEQFQLRLLEPVKGEPDAPSENELWAKSNHRRRAKGVRPYFRHELASALAWWSLGPRDDARWHALVAFLIAAHHGKVRVSLRSVPGERAPESPQRRHARGVWDGDTLPAVQLPGGTRAEGVILDLAPMELGAGSWLDRVLALRDDPDLGPFRLAFLETLVRVADWRASEKERRDA